MQFLCERLKIVCRLSFPCAQFSEKDEVSTDGVKKLRGHRNLSFKESEKRIGNGLGSPLEKVELQRESLDDLINLDVQLYKPGGFAFLLI